MASQSPSRLLEITPADRRDRAAGREHPARAQRRGGGRAVRRRLLAGLGAAALLLLAAAPAGADEYEARRAGHPLRILAYALHPVGVVADRLLMRPAHWLVHHEPFKTLFGHKGDD